MVFFDRDIRQLLMCTVGIAMARVLYDGLVEYEDGTPATTSQMAKDVVEFLNFAAEPEMDQRKKMGWATIIVTSALLGLSIWVKRLVLMSSLAIRWSLICPADTSGHPSRRGRLSTTLQSPRKEARGYSLARIPAGLATIIRDRWILCSDFVRVGDAARLYQRRVNMLAFIGHFAVRSLCI